MNDNFIPVIRRLPDDRYRNATGQSKTGDIVFYDPPPAPSKKDVLAAYICGIPGVLNLIGYGCLYKEGYCFDFRGRGLKKYVVKRRESGVLQECWAPDELYLAIFFDEDVQYILPIPEKSWEIDENNF